MSHVLKILLDLTFRPLADQVRGSLTQQRVVAQLAGFFGAVAVLLAALGLYGLVAYSVSRRRTEIGIRMAVGATGGNIIGLVLGRISWIVGIGIACGMGLSVWASQFVAGLVYGIPPRDPATLVTASLVLAAVGGLAGWLPARRAARIDPVITLRA